MSSWKHNKRYNCLSACSYQAENDDHKTPKEDHSKGKDPPSKRNKPNELGSQQHHRKVMDWREFRASLFAHEQVALFSFFGKYATDNKTVYPLTKMQPTINSSNAIWRHTHVHIKYILHYNLNMASVHHTPML